MHRFRGRRSTQYFFDAVINFEVLVEIKLIRRMHILTFVATREVCNT